MLINVRFPRALILGGLASLIAGADLCAQGGTLAVGARVRVHYVGGTSDRLRVGALVRADSSTVAITNERNSEVTTIPRQTVFSVERSVPDGRHTGDGMVIGLLGGALVTALVGEMTAHCPRYGECYKDLGIAASSVAGGILGLVVGGVIGSHIPSERWEESVLPNRVVPDQK